MFTKVILDHREDIEGFMFAYKGWGQMLAWRPYTSSKREAIVIDLPTTENNYGASLPIDTCCDL